MNRIPRKLALFLTGFAGIFGIRTPPEPDVVAQMQPARPRAAAPRDDMPDALQVTLLDHPAPPPE